MKKTILISIIVIVTIVTNAQTTTFPSLGKMKRQAEKGNPEAVLQLADYYYVTESYHDAIVNYFHVINDYPKALFMIGQISEKGIPFTMSKFTYEIGEDNLANYNNQNYNYWYNLAEKRGYTKQNYLSDLANKGSDTQEDYRNDVAFQEKTKTKRANNISKENERKEKEKRAEDLKDYERRNGIVHNGWLVSGLTQGLQDAGKTFKETSAEMDALSRGSTVAQEKEKAERDAAFYESVERNKKTEEESKSSSSSNSDSNSKSSSSGNSSEDQNAKLYSYPVSRTFSGGGLTEEKACEDAIQIGKETSRHQSITDLKIGSCDCKLQKTWNDKVGKYECSVTISGVATSRVNPDAKANNSPSSGVSK